MTDQKDQARKKIIISAPLVYTTIDSKKTVTFDRALVDEVTRRKEAEQAQLDNWFSYHAPKDVDQAHRYESLRIAGKILAHTIVGLCPPSADRTASLRKLREAIFTANASIACDGK